MASREINNYSANRSLIRWYENGEKVLGESDTLRADEDLIFTGSIIVQGEKEITFSAPKIKINALVRLKNGVGNSITFEHSNMDFDSASWDESDTLQGDLIFSGDSKLNLTSESNKLLIICNDISGTITLDLDNSFVSGSTFSIQANSANNLIINNTEGYEVIPMTDGNITTYTVNRVAIPEVKEFVLTDGKVYKVKDETARTELSEIAKTIPTKTSQLENDSGFITAGQPADVPVKDVQANGTSIVTDGVANIPIARAGGKLGLVFPAGFGVNVTASGAMATVKATEALLLAKANNFQPVVPSNLDSAIKISITTNTITLTGEEKANACNWLGAEQISTIQTLNATDSITLTNNTIYNGGEQTSLTIALPTYVDVSFLCEIDFTSPATATTLTYPQSGIVWIGDDVSNNVFTAVASKRYTIICAYDGVNYRFVVKGV